MMSADGDEIRSELRSGLKLRSRTQETNSGEELRR